jgi:peptidoglycan/LPS O-acetylase OafA/YrhL
MIRQLAINQVFQSRLTDRWSVLAILRFALASIVAINHLDAYVELGLLSFIHWFGAFEAILGFLLISGYSVGTSYVMKPKGFFIRRLKRLLPIYIASIVLTVAINICILKENLPSVLEIALNLMFLNQLFTTTSYVGPAWSLSLEFWLYCILPFLMLCSPRVLRAAVYMSFSGYLVYTCLRTLLHLPYYSHVGFGLNLLLLSFTWICGMRLARGNEPSRLIMNDVGIVFAGHIILASTIQFLFRVKNSAVSQFFTDDLHKLFLPSLTLGAMYLIFHLISNSRVGVIKSPTRSVASVTAEILGDISYPLYLIHIPVFMYLTSVGLQSAVLLYASSVFASFTMYWFIDFYSRKRKTSSHGSVAGQTATRA